MIQAFDVLLQIPVTADVAAKNRIDEPFRYECLCCGEEVYIAATNSTKKAPHFRHRRGNSDRECELYLGSTGIAGALNAAQKRTHSRTEIYFDIKQKIFYAAVSFPKEKLQEFEDKSCILEFHPTYNSPPYEKVRINHQNFAKEIGILKAKIADLSATIETLQGELECQIIRIKQFEQTEVIQRKELHDAISVNTTLDAELKKLKAELREAQVTIDTAKKRESGQQATIDTLQSKLSEIQKVAEDLDAKIYRESDNLLCPVDIDEFSEYLGYNLSSIGVDSSTDEYFLLVDFLGDILFQDKPIICNRIAGIALAKCVSNTLCGSQEIKVLSYTSEVTSNDILNYLRLETRICVLDGFLGNYNEMELISILRSIKGRIIFITFNYERTMAYLPQEILLYFNYVNVSRIKGFFSEAIIDEDASVIPEEWTSVAHKSVNGRAERLCNEIMKQLGFGADVTMLLSQRMISEEKLVQYLAFSILPYSSEALDCRPYEVSDRLQKYAGEQGKCKQKSLLLGWFGNE